MNPPTSAEPGSLDVNVVKHVVISASELNELPLSSYKCDLCGLKVKTKANLRAHHIKTHHILKSDSDVAFYSKKKNTITYVYHCPIASCKHNIECDGGFASFSRLKQVLLCSFGRRVMSFSKHFQIVHMSKSYACDRCEQRFATPSAQAYHVKLCGKTYSCSLCSKTYTVRKHLMQHFRRTGHHRVTDNQCGRVQTGKRSACLQGLNFLNPSAPVLGHVEPDFRNEVAPTPLQPPPATFIPVLILPIPVPAMTDWNNFSLGARSMASADPFVSPVLFSDAKIQSVPDASEPESAPSLTQYPVEVVPQAYIDPSLEERSTQTVRVDAAVDATVSGSYNTSVSVNIGTDEDDISAFLGSLFCDASVETKFPATQLVHEYTDTALDANEILDSIDRISQYADAAFDTNDLPCNQTKSDYPDTEPTQLLTGTTEKFSGQIITLTHEGSQSVGLLTSFDKDQESSCDHRVTRPIPTVTHDTRYEAEQNYFTPIRPLETPPPLRTQNPSQLLTIYQSTPDGIQPVDSPMPIPCRMSAERNAPVDRVNHGISEIGCQYSRPPIMQSDACECTEDHLPSFQSIGLQSNLWSPTGPVCASMETQTMDADLESWLNSVHTQTSASPFDIHAFTDMSVGVNEDYLTSDFDSVETTDRKYAN
ncbi:unnamed protein product [Echinostoma caproni]|uniref:C2H2-type domain-containing protein n=1 Tax=Echinostoma caproni TaxID=27848 RepID=A0A183AY16_9TREM|nr:unnamed protein product [Echinostoma caproni]